MIEVFVVIERPVNLTKGGQSVDSSEKVGALYAARVQIEEDCRHLKSQHFGLSL
jgi:hypothetical protein